MEKTIDDLINMLEVLKTTAELHKLELTLDRDQSFRFALAVSGIVRKIEEIEYIIDNPEEGDILF